LICKILPIYVYGKMSQIEGYENYIIFEDGKIINTKFDREMKPCINKGYYRIGIRKDNKRNFFTIHRLIALTFIPNPENKPCIDHINRNKLDNRIENLRWVSNSENNRNKTGYSNTGKQFIFKIKSKTMKQGYLYRFQIQRPELQNKFSNGDLQPVIEYRNNFCEEHNIEINDN